MEALLCLHKEGVFKEALQDGLDVVNVFLTGYHPGKQKRIERVPEQTQQCLENSGAVGEIKASPDIHNVQWGC